MDFSTEQRLNYLLTDESLNYMACQSICRLCGEFIYDGAENIFVKGGGVLRHHIESLTGLWLEDISNMPDQICIPCSFDLDQAVAFRERCISTQLRLLKNVHDNSNRTNIGFEIYELGECGKSPDPATTNGSQIHESSTDCIGVWDNPEDGIGHSNPPQIVGEATMHQRRIRKRKHVCEKCRRKFDNTEFYEKHLLRHLANGRFHCKLCDLKYDRKSDFARHLRSFHERKELLPCRHDKCNEKFTSQTYRLKHEKRHLKNNRFARFYCKLGGHTFERKCHFIGHICLVHKDKTPDEITNNSGEILNPLQNGEVATTEESNVHKIEDCGGSLVKRRLYCKLCGRVFGRNSNLLRHMRYHKEKKSIPCTYDNCNMEFISVAARLEHEAKHTMLNEERREHEMSDPSPKVQKPDDICNMEVKPQSNRLDNGSSDDSGECNKPEEGSEYSNPLRTEDVATTENRNVQKKKYLCGKCRQQFSSGESYEKHLLRHLKSGRYLCKLCDIRYYRTYNLVRHMQLCHKNKKPDDIGKMEFRPQSTELVHETSDDSGECNKPEEGSENLNPLQTEDVATTEGSYVHETESSCDKCGCFVKERFYCKLCDRRFGRRYNFLRHIRSVHKNKVPEDICNMEVEPQPTRLDDESSDNSGQCNKPEEGSENLNPIENEDVTSAEQSQVPKRGNYCAQCRHSEIKYFSCKLCGRGFDRKYTFVRHVRLVHKNKMPDDICNIELRPRSTRLVDKK